MESILTQINQIPHDYFFMGLFFITFFTCMGVFPGHTDLTVFASSLIATNGKFPFFGILGIILTAILIGENSMFLLGHKLGSRVFQFKFFSRIMPEKRREVFRLGFLQYPNRFLLALRMSPVFRPYIYLSVGSLGLSYSTFFKYHFKWTVSYILGVFTLSYFGSQFIRELNIPPFLAVISAFIAWFLVLKWISKSLGNLVPSAD